MVKIVGVRFKKAGKIYYFDPGDLELASGMHVIVETVRGIEHGQVVVGPKFVPEDDIVQPLKQVIRIATEADARQVEENRRKAERAFDIGLAKIASHGLPMKLVDVEYTFDNSKIIFYFTADGRVDFRELVRDLASVFRVRIELRQIGVRDEAKMLGGIGPCGRPLCCATFLGDFEPVSIKMAKEQNLSLNPTKISGICGRLMCCLKYEYCPKRAPGSVPHSELPEPGTEVMTEDGCGRVLSIDPATSSVTVQFSDGRTCSFPADSVEPVNGGCEGACEGSCGGACAGSSDDSCDGGTGGGNGAGGGCDGRAES